MRNRSQKGFTLIELLIVIAIIGILAAVLIPNLLNARQRAFDTAAQTCLKEIATLEEINASVDPWEYTEGGFQNDYAADDPTVTIDGEDFTIQSCARVNVVDISEDEGTLEAGVDNFGYSALHSSGSTTYFIRNGGGVLTADPFAP